jgi:ubiquinone/menaquinone biosynthesis C-methylase UbiE
MLLRRFLIVTQIQDNEYWSRFWSEYKADIAEKDEQSQVLRTRNKLPIDKDIWEFTVSDVAGQLALTYDDTLLDLCCGNGLFSSAFSSQVAKIEAVDISAPLIERLNSKGLSNVHALANDIRKVDFKDQSFSKVLWYAGIQYIDESDIIKMIRKIRRWMKPGGILMIGDIPDRKKLWKYFDTIARQDIYFDALERREPIIGTWLDAEWIEKLCFSSGFTAAHAVEQNDKLIYADFRYDLVAKV